MKIKQATIDDLEHAGKLFADYRVFYGQPFDIEAAKTFLANRIRQKDSVMFVVVDEEQYVGFAQLYPSFSSVGLKEIWILNDLYVDAQHRQKGIAQALIQHILEYSKTTGRKRLVLSTAYDNRIAQNLYEKSGFIKEEFFNYEKSTEE
jgi:ribosomal protein S18 acetylase RimI-like enzyme